MRIFIHTPKNIFIIKKNILSQFVKVVHYKIQLIYELQYLFLKNLLLNTKNQWVILKNITFLTFYLSDYLLFINS